MHRTAALGLSLAVAGCASYLERSAQGPVVDPPARYAEVPEADPPREARAALERSPARWGTALGAPDLDTLLLRAIRSNYEIDAAVARIRQADALARQARAALLPIVGAEAGASYSSSVNPPFGRSETSDLTFSLPVGYELDLFGRYVQGHRASRLDAEAAARDASALAIAVAARVAEAWLDVVETHARRRLLEAQLESNQSYLQLVTLRFEGGLTSDLDVHQQEQLVARSESLVSNVLGQEVVAANQLSVLLGEAPGRVFARGIDALPTLPDLPETGIPASLLEERPDLEAAALRLEAADRRVASAIRDQLPALRVDVAPGYTIVRRTFSETSIGGIAQQQSVRGHTLAAGASLTVPIFDGLRGPAIADQRRGEVAERLAEYRQAFLLALSEVENALALERQQRLNIVNLERLVSAATATLETARTRYSAGLSDYLPVLTALREQQNAELLVLEARRRLVSHRLQLYRALGASLPADSLD